MKRWFSILAGLTWLTFWIGPVQLRAEANTVLPIASVSTSSHQDPNVPANTLDGNLGTRWSAQGDGEWIQYDLGVVATVTRVAIAHFKGDQRQASFTIEVSQNGTNWDEVFSGDSSGTRLELEVYAVSATAARYVRIVGYGNTQSDWNSLTEVEIQGTRDPELHIASVSASGHQDPNVPANTLDGNLGTRWSAQGRGAWIRYDLGIDATVSQVAIAHFQGAQRQASFTIEVSRNGRSWDEVFRGNSSGTTLGLEVYAVSAPSARYVRIVGHGNTRSDWNSLTEVEIRGQRSTPKIPVSSVTASDHQSPNVPANTLDDNLGTRWSAQGDGAWIQYDLGGNASVSRIAVAHFEGDQRQARFTIKVSRNGTNWDNVFRGNSSGTTLALEAYTFRATTARYVRIVGHGNTQNNWNSLTEVEIHGSRDASDGITLDGLEVTQSIQDMDHSVPLVAGKRTVVRAYLSNPSSRAITVRGQLRVTQNPPDGRSRTFDSINTVMLDPADSYQLRHKREDVNASVNFVLPTSWVTAGTLEMHISRLTDVSTGNTVPCSNCSGESLEVDSVDSAPLRVHIIGLRYQTGSPATTHTPSTTDFNLIKSWLGRAFPVADVRFSQVIMDATSTWPFECSTANAQVAAVRSLDIDGGVDTRTHYYGLVADSGGFMRGCASVPSSPLPSAIGSGPTGPGSWGWDFDGSYGDWYTGHELGHTFGRHHPGSGCGDSSSDPHYPFPNGQLSHSDGAFVGFDVGDASLGIPMRALPGEPWHDVMSYCDRQWLSSYTYEGIQDRLNGEDALAPGALADESSLLSGADHTETLARIAGAEHGAQDAVSARLENGEFLNIVATLNLTRNTGQIYSVQRVSRAAIAPEAKADPARIRLLDASGYLLGEYPVVIKYDTDIPEGEDRTGIVDDTIPFLPASATLELVLAGQVVDTLHTTDTPPTVRHLRLPSGAILGAGIAGKHQAPLVFTWEGNDPDDGEVTYSVQLSADHGATWRTLAIGLSSPRLEIDADQLKGLRNLTVRVIANSGFHRSVLTSETIQIPAP